MENYILIALLAAAAWFLWKRGRQNKSKTKVPLPSKAEKQRLSMDEAFNLAQKEKQVKLDRLLDKIHQKGFESLSKQEKDQLRELSK